MEMTKYIDERGWKYKVMGDLAGTYKARYQRPEKNGDVCWKGVGKLPRRATKEEAQADLDQLAESKGWKPWEGYW